MLIENKCDKAMPVPCAPQNKNISEGLASINYALSEIESVVDTILCKIEGVCQTGSAGQANKEPCCISELLETMKAKSERIFHRIDQANSMI